VVYDLMDGGDLERQLSHPAPAVPGHASSCLTELERVLVRVFKFRVVAGGVSCFSFVAICTLTMSMVCLDSCDRCALMFAMA
jgi:hypothetical protein